MAKVLAILHLVLAKLVAYQAYIVFSFIFLMIALMIWSLVRQRRIKQTTRLMLANFENLRVKIEEVGAQGRRQAQELSAALPKQFKDLIGELKNFSNAIAERTGQVSQHVDSVGTNLREQLTEVQNSLQALASSGGDAGIVELATRIEELSDETAWSHHYYDELKTLEVAVLNLVGPEKMRQLVEKEKGGGSRATKEEIFRKL